MRKVALIFSFLPFLLISCSSDFPDTFNNNKDILEILQGVNTIKITSKNENLILNNAVINRGNCSLEDVLALPEHAQLIRISDNCNEISYYDNQEYLRNLGLPGINHSAQQPSAQRPNCGAVGISYDRGVSIKHLVDEFPKMLSTGKIDMPLKFGESAEFRISCHAIEVEIDTNIGKRNFSWNAQ